MSNIAAGKPEVNFLWKIFWLFCFSILCWAGSIAQNEAAAAWTGRKRLVFSFGPSVAPQ